MPTIDPTTVTNAQELERYAELAALELCDLIDGAPTMRSAAPYARALVVALEFSELPPRIGDADPPAPPDVFATFAQQIAQSVRYATAQALEEQDR